MTFCREPGVAPLGYDIQSQPVSRFDVEPRREADRLLRSRLSDTATTRFACSRLLQLGKSKLRPDAYAARGPKEHRLAVARDTVRKRVVAAVLFEHVSGSSVTTLPLLAVHADHGSRGLGAALVRVVMSEAAARGSRHIVVASCSEKHTVEYWMKHKWNGRHFRPAGADTGHHVQRMFNPWSETTPMICSI